MIYLHTFDDFQNSTFREFQKSPPEVFSLGHDPTCMDTTHTHTDIDSIDIAITRDVSIAIGID